jgi:hypothetical protein
VSPDSQRGSSETLPVLFSSDADFAVGAFRYGQVVPEPLTWLLLGAGLLGLAALRRRFVQ